MDVTSKTLSCRSNSCMSSSMIATSDCIIIYMGWWWIIWPTPNHMYNATTIVEYRMFSLIDQLIQNINNGTSWGQLFWCMTCTKHFSSTTYHVRNMVVLWALPDSTYNFFAVDWIRDRLIRLAILHLTYCYIKLHKDNLNAKVIGSQSEVYLSLWIL